MADVDRDVAPAGTLLVAVPAGASIDTTWTYDQATSSFVMPAAMQAAQAAQAASIQSQAYTFS
jgi:hypothetical protein